MCDNQQKWRPTERILCRDGSKNTAEKPWIVYTRKMERFKWACFLVAGTFTTKIHTHTHTHTLMLITCSHRTKRSNGAIPLSNRMHLVYWAIVRSPENEQINENNHIVAESYHRLPIFTILSIFRFRNFFSEQKKNILFFVQYLPTCLAGCTFSYIRLPFTNVFQT